MKYFLQCFVMVGMATQLVAQNDLGSNTNGGALTEGRLPNEDQVIRLQVKELMRYESGFQQLLGATPDSVSKEYEAVRRDTAISPLRFLAKLKVLHDRNKALPIEAFATVMSTGKVLSQTDAKSFAPPDKKELAAAEAQFKTFKK